jgi:ribosomal protein L7/L12
MENTMPTEVIVTESELPSAVIRLIADGRKIEAIKVLRESTGLGLANAKVLVDRASRVHGPKKAANAAISADGSAKLIVSVLAVLILAAAYLYFL